MGPVDVTNLSKRFIHQGMVGFTLFAFLLVQLFWPLPVSARDTLRQEPLPESKSGPEELKGKLIGEREISKTAPTSTSIPGTPMLSLAGFPGAPPAGLEEKFVTPVAAISHLLGQPEDRPFVDRMKDLAKAKRLVDSSGNPLQRSKLSPFLTLAEETDHLGESPETSNRTAQAYGDRYAETLATVAHQRYFATLPAGNSARLYGLVHALIKAGEDGALPRAPGRNRDPQTAVNRFLRFLPELAHRHFRHWIQEWNDTGRLAILPVPPPPVAIPSTTPAPMVLMLGGRLFTMDGIEARAVLKWAAGAGPLEPGKEYLAVAHPRVPGNAPHTVLAHVLPPTVIKGEKAALGLGISGESIAVTRLLRSRAEEGEEGWQEESLPLFLYRYHQDLRTQEKWIAIYRLPAEIDPGEAYERREEWFGRVSSDPNAYLGAVLIQFPTDFSREPASNKHLSVLAPVEIFSHEAASLAGKDLVADFPGRFVQPLTGDGLAFLWSALEVAGVKPARGLQQEIERLVTAERVWTHLVLQRIIRTDPYGHRHFLIRANFVKQPEGAMVSQEESPLQLVALLVSNHPQWSGERYAYRPSLPAWSVGLVDARDIPPGERTINVRTIAISLHFLQRAAGRPGGETAKRDRFDRYQRAIDLPFFSPGSSGQFPGFSFVAARHTTRVVGRSVRENGPEAWPLEFYEDSVSGKKWIGLRRPQTVSPYQPEIWVRMSSKNRIEPGIEVDRKFRRDQMRRAYEAAQRYLQGETTTTTPWVQVRIMPSGFPTRRAEGYLDVRLYIPSSRIPGEKKGFPSVRTLPPGTISTSAANREFFLTPPTSGIRTKRPFLRSVDVNTGTILYFYLTEEGQRTLRVNELPTELADASELMVDILVARGFTPQESKSIVDQLRRAPFTSSVSLTAYQVSQARRLDDRGIKQIPEADRIAPSGLPLVLVPMAPNTPGAEGIRGLLVTTLGLAPLSPARFDLYTRLPDAPAAGLEELVLLTQPEVELTKGILQQDALLRETLEAIKKVYNEEIVAFLKDQGDPAAKEIATLLEGPEGISTLLALLGRERATSYETALAVNVEKLLDMTPQQIVETLRDEEVRLFQERFPGRVPGGYYNYPRFWDKGVRTIYERYLRERGEGYQSMDSAAFDNGLNKLQKFIESKEAAAFLKEVIAYDPDYHYQQIKGLWEQRHTTPYLSKEAFHQLVQEPGVDTLRQHPELLSALFATYDYPAFQLTTFETQLQADLQNTIQTFVAEEGKRLGRALEWTKAELTEEGDEERTQRQKKIWAYLKIRQEGVQEGKGGYRGLITGKQIRQYLKENEGLFSEKSAVQILQQLEASEEEKKEALFALTLYDLGPRLSKVRGKPDGKKKAEVLFEKVTNAILAYSLTDQSMVRKFAEGTEPLVGLTAVDQVVGDRYRDLQKASRIVEPGTTSADLQLIGVVHPLIPKRVKRELDKIRKTVTALLVQAGQSVSGRSGVIVFEPMGFEKGYRGYIGEDCTTCDTAQAFAALHPANRYYAIRKEGRDYGYVGLTEAEVSGAADLKVLVVDTIQSPASIIPTKHIPEILDRLDQIARHRGFIGIALPDKLTPTFNHQQVRHAIDSHPKYDAAESSGYTLFLEASAGEALKSLGPYFGVSDASESLAGGFFYLWTDIETAKAKAEEIWLKEDPVGHALIRNPEYWIDSTNTAEWWDGRELEGASHFLNQVLDRLKRWNGGTELSVEQQNAVWKVFEEVFRHFSEEGIKLVVRDFVFVGEDLTAEVLRTSLPGILEKHPPGEVIPQICQYYFNSPGVTGGLVSLRSYLNATEQVSEKLPDFLKEKWNALLRGNLVRALAPLVLEQLGLEPFATFQTGEEFEDLVFHVVMPRWLKPGFPLTAVSRKELKQLDQYYTKIMYTETESKDRETEDDLADYAPEDPLKDWSSEMWETIVREIREAYYKASGTQSQAEGESTAGLEEIRDREVVGRLAEMAERNVGVMVIAQSGLEEHPELMKLAQRPEFAKRIILFGAVATAAQLAQLRESGVRIIDENDFDGLVIALLSMEKADRVNVLEEASTLTQALAKVLPHSMRVIHIAIGAQIKAILSAFIPEEELDQLDPEALGTLARLSAA